MAASIKRRIYVYKIGFWDINGQSLAPTAPKPAFDYVRTLAAQDGDPSRYMQLADGNQLIMEMVDTPQGAPAGSIRGRFGIKRLTGLPRIELYGNYSDLQLDVGAGLAELRHFVVDPKRGLLGLELNGNAPGPGRWATYLAYKCPNLELVTTDMLLAGSLADTLKRVGRIAGTTLTVYSNELDALDGLDANLRSGLKALKKTSDNARELTVAFELGSQKSNETLDLDWRGKVASFLGSKKGRQAVNDFKVRAFDRDAGNTRWIDLLEDKFVGYKQVVTLDEAGRIIDSDSMFRAIDEVLVGLPANL